mmetsp:Transcript_28564/g.82381  ORF Transcript_28564/g.82381 Transcript_28564/m.82381 type:complete len:263 (-) Transcript_28564:469-1257(-)
MSLISTGRSLVFLHTTALPAIIASANFSAWPPNPAMNTHTACTRASLMSVEFSSSGVIPYRSMLASLKQMTRWSSASWAVTRCMACLMASSVLSPAEQYWAQAYMLSNTRSRPISVSVASGCCPKGTNGMAALSPLWPLISMSNLCRDWSAVCEKRLSSNMAAVSSRRCSRLSYPLNLYMEAETSKTKDMRLGSGVNRGFSGRSALRFHTFLSPVSASTSRLSSSSPLSPTCQTRSFCFASASASICLSCIISWLTPSFSRR